jgi:hypothetical protein
MATGFYLLDNQNKNGTYNSDGRYQGRMTRRGVITCIVLHSSENHPDITPPDRGAESVASYLSMTDRQASYHWVGDSDSEIELLPHTHEAYGCRFGFNQFSYHISIATKADSWDKVPVEWRSAIGLRAAVKAAAIAKQHGIPPVLLSREQALAGQKGFISHGIADPTRRSDPGFGSAEWLQFLKTVSQINSAQPQEEADVIYALDVINRTSKGRHFFWSCTPSGAVTPFNGAEHLGDLAKLGVVPAKPVVAMIPYNDGDTTPGYWLISADGGIFNFGDAPYPESHPSFMVAISPNLSKPVVAGAQKGRVLVLMAADGGTFGFPI